MKLGQICGTSPQHIVVRPEFWNIDDKLPKLGTKVSNENLKNIGTLVDIFGPTKRPYFSIKPTNPSLLTSSTDKLGAFVYTIKEKKRSGRSRRPKTNTYRKTKYTKKSKRYTGNKADSSPYAKKKGYSNSKSHRERDQKNTKN